MSFNEQNTVSHFMIHQLIQQHGIKNNWQKPLNNRTMILRDKDRNTLLTIFATVDMPMEV